MSSCKSPLWRRMLYKVTPLLFKKCPCENYHWRSDDICYCMENEYCGDKGGVYDFKNKRWLIPMKTFNNVVKIKSERGDLLYKIGNALGMKYPLENKEEILKKLKEKL